MTLTPAGHTTEASFHLPIGRPNTTPLHTGVQTGASALHHVSRTPWFSAPAQTLTDPAGIEFAAVSTMSTPATTPFQISFDQARNSVTSVPGVGVAAVQQANQNFYVSQDKLGIRWTALRGLLVPYVDRSLAPAGTIGVELEFAGAGFPLNNAFNRWPFTTGWITSLHAALDYTFDPSINHIDTNSIEAFVRTNSGYTYGADGSPPAQINEWFIGDRFLGTSLHPTPFGAGIRASASLPVGTANAHLNVPFSTSDIGFNFALPDRDAWSIVVITSRNATDGEIPGGSSVVPSGIQMTSDGTAAITVVYQPPRFRFVYRE